MKYEQVRLVEGLDDIRAKYPNISDDDFYTIVRADPTYNRFSGELGAGATWLLNQYNKGKFTIDELPKAVKRFKDMVDELKQSQIEGEDVGIAYEDDKWIVYTPNTFEAFETLADDANWYLDKNDFNDKLREGPVYVVIIKEDESDKYQLHFPSQTFEDYSGDSIDLFEYFKGDILNFFMPMIVSCFYKDLGITEETPGDATVTYRIETDPYYDLIESKSSTHRDSLSGKWITDFLYSPNDAFNWDGLYYRHLATILAECGGISDANFERLKELGCKAETKEELYDANEDELREMLPEEIYDDIQDAFNWAYDEGYEEGSINQCQSDILSAIEELFVPLDAACYCDGATINGTRNQWEDFIANNLKELSIDYNYDDLSLYPLLKELFADKFDVSEPYYGWNEYDNEAFDDRLYELLYDIDFTPDENTRYGGDSDDDYDEEDIELQDYDDEEDEDEDNYKESLDESLQEDIEKHDTLNPLLWNEDNTLKQEVKDKLMQIADEFIKGLEEDGIKLDVDDIKIVGSNCSYNYTKDSDIDLHIVAKNIEAPEDLYALLYSAYRSIWNKNYDIDFYGIPVEIFVETPELVRDEVTTIDVEV